jgi:hypothetical protein
LNIGFFGQNFGRIVRTIKSATDFLVVGIGALLASSLALYARFRHGPQGRGRPDPTAADGARAAIPTTDRRHAFPSCPVATVPVLFLEGRAVWVAASSGSAVESRLRRQARRLGLRVIKSRENRGAGRHGLGPYVVVDDRHGDTVSSERGMGLEELADFLREAGSP